LLDFICKLFNDPFFLFDYIDQVFDDILIVAHLTGIPLASEMLHLKFEVIDQLALFGELYVQ